MTPEIEALVAAVQAAATKNETAYVEAEKARLASGVAEDRWIYTRRDLSTAQDLLLSALAGRKKEAEVPR